MLKITIIRHGESVDNLRPVWAGTLDGPLTNFGMNQATLLAWDQRDVHYDRIYASDLTRAHWTARMLWNYNRNPDVEDAVVSGDDSNLPAEPPLKRDTPSTLPEPVTCALLREQHFGDAEGATWSGGEFSGFSNPWQTDLDFKFSNGESLNDVKARAKQFVDAVVRPWLLLSAEENHHIGIVAHGISIRQLLQVLAELDPLDNLVLPEAMGLGNCCYHRMELSLQSSVEVAPDILKKAKQVVQQTPVPTEPFALEEDARVAPVQLKHVAQSDHLDGLIRNRADPREKMDAFARMHQDIQAGKLGAGQSED